MKSGAQVLRPAPIAFFVLTVNILAAAVYSNENFAQIRSVKSYKNFDLLGLGLLSFVFIFSVALGTRMTVLNKIHNDISIRTFVRYEKRLFSLVVIGYLVWTILAISRGLNLQLLLDIASFQKNSVVITKNLLKGIAGVTTLTQLTPILSAILGFLRLHGQPWKFHFLFITFFGVIRAVLNAERLSIFEFLVPFIVVHIFYAPKIKLARILPIVLAFPIIFSVLEYTRSWTNYYSRVFDGSFLDFSLFRLFSYYATATNNGFLLIDKIGQGPRHPFYSFNFIYEFPVFGQDIAIGNEIYDPRMGLLRFFKNYSNPEFNNPGGFTSLVLDFGWALACIYLLVIGFLVGVLWKKALGDHRAAVLYSALFLGLLELPRYFFFGSSRFFPSLAIGLVILFRKERP